MAAMLSEDSYIVQMNPEHCSCKTPLQVAFFIHFCEGDTDSAYWAICGNTNEDFTQQFNAVIKDIDFYNDNAKYFFPTIKGNVYDEKKILGLAIERQGPSMIALAPKNYMIFKNYCDDSKIKLKGVNQKTNKITKEQIVDCVYEGKITKCTNMRLGQKNHKMSQLSIEKNGITGIHTKMVVLSDQSCCPYIFGLVAKDYSMINSYFFISPKFTPKQITCVNILAVLNKQVGRQAIKKIVFLLCLESLTRCVIVLDNYELNLYISALEPMSSNSINVLSNQAFSNIVTNILNQRRDIESQYLGWLTIFEYFISSNSGRNIIASPYVTFVNQMFLLFSLHINVVLPLPTAPTIQ
ncbi:MAG: hypothetical protein EZS28_006441 [Streblomastix strix]|uniref:Uncharacterized protein n=1 Tax=Streblomastix strix TaxID=222440 RepID=A0A5J4WSX4_9EUKA|nr:MAG: hypothetical protein EZS28_006441 [Streblomastix strix]